MSLADSMSKSPETFPRVYTAMVQAGETGGFLDLVLAQIADFQAREKELRSKVMAAMLYPCVLLVLALAVLVFLLTFFIPKFQVIFKGLGAALPLPTQIVLGMSYVVRSYGVFVAVGIVVLLCWFGAGLHRKRGGGFGRGSYCGCRSSGRSWPSSPWRGSAGCSAHFWARACRWSRV